MKNTLSLALLSLCFLVVFNCKKTPDFKYRYSNITNPITCSTPLDSELLKEAVLSFEADITNFPPRLPSLAAGFSQMGNYLSGKRPLPKNKISKHSQDVFEALKNEKDLWQIQSNGKHGLNYNHPLVKCIGDNLQDKDIKATFNALVSTNSMSQKLIEPILRSKLKTAIDDKHLSAFIALDTYYAQFFEIDFSTDVQQEDKKKPTKPAVQNK